MHLISIIIWFILISYLGTHGTKSYSTVKSSFDNPTVVAETLGINSQEESVSYCLMN